MLDRVKRGRATGKQLFDYYLGWITDPSVKKHIRLIPDSEVAFARQWGMRVEIEDLRGSCARPSAAAAGSWWAATRWAARSRRPTPRGTSAGDRARRGSRASSSSTAGRARPPSPRAGDGVAADAEHRSPWLSFGGIPAPYAGLFNSSGSLGAIVDPDSPSLGQTFPPCPRTSSRRCA
jgi:hypothetical protein